LHGHNHIILLTNKTITLPSPHLPSAEVRNMKKTKALLFSSLINRKPKCKFTHSCSLYSNASYTCTHTGGSYCGKYRKLSRSGENFGSNQYLIEVPQ